ncbi:zinc transporter ZntB [Puniceibacterium sediminis]|uniref:Zinc transporter n=1 Tax=Puniceibacterium sediminis TaxID=1608407 RepID=A0A238W3R6_9RHOB|nr:zinc transporter ZntB [Puniceibacterium sediminis]SNR41192.1 zinc transporter [Puniceibacterium sediminis]
MNPIFALDISPDGRSTPTSDLSSPVTNGYRWVHCDLSDPGLPAWLAAQVPGRAKDALLEAETRPRAFAHDGGLIVILRGLNLNVGEDRDDMVSLRGWFSERLIVTTRIRRIFAAEDLRRKIEANHAPPTPAAFLVSLAENLTDRIEENGVALEDRLDDLEEILFLDDRAPESESIPELRRATIRLGRFLNPQAAALHALLDTRLPLIDAAMRENLGEIANGAQRAVEELNAVRDRLTVLTDHLESRQNVRLAKNSYALSVVAAVFLPMGFLTGLFGVNVAGMPGTDMPHAFAVLSLGTVAMGLLVWLILRFLRLF